MTEAKATDFKDTVTIRSPDDFHVHVRDGGVLAAVVPAVAQFRRALIMPNLKPPVLTTKDALAYRERILAALAKSTESKAAPAFTPLMSLYLTDNTPPEEIVAAKKSGHVYAVKLYPAGATTNSASGVTDISKTFPTLREMAKLGMPLLIHGETTDQSVDIFDREKVFITTVLAPLIKEIPDLKIVMEHITTKQAAEFVAKAPANVGATITAHHLLYNRNVIFKGGVCPHYYCLPVLKREDHRVALVAAATSGSAKFFAGTDSAPHPKGLKEHSCGCAGCYTSFAAVELYTEVFDKAGALDKLQAFVAENGAKFYGLELNEGTVTLRRESWKVPAEFAFDTAADPPTVVVPIRAGESMPWKLQSKAEGKS